MAQFSETVLITGATTGIGYELSKLFAKDNYRMVIVGPEPATLHNVSEVLKTLGAAKVITICADLTTEKGADEVLAETVKQKIRVDILVNDCVYGLPGRFTEASLVKDLHVLNTNIISMVKLTKYFVNQMVSQNQGRILQLASLDDHTNSTFRTVYAATKAFISTFTESLRQEVQNRGVIITSVLGSTVTDNPILIPSWPDEKETDPSILARLGYNTLLRVTSGESSNLKGTYPGDIIPLKTRQAS